MRLATFNLLHGMSIRGTAQDSALAAAIESLNADVLGLQEVDVHQERSSGAHQVQVAAQASGAQWWRFVPAVRGTPGVERDWVPAGDDDHHSDGSPVFDSGPRYGIGLVSRLPVLEWRTTSFEPAPWKLPLLIPGSPRPQFMLIPDEPRVAVAAVIDGPHGRFTVATTHLSFVPGYNMRQLRRLRTWLADMPRPLVLLGDFNLPGSLPRRLTGWQSLAAVPTYPSYRPRVQFDHVLVDGISSANVAAAQAQSLALAVSDHCALTVDVTLQ